MTAQFREPLGPLQGSCQGEKLWIVGGGPSLDDVDILRLKDRYVFVLNTAYLLFPTTREYRDVWMVFYDLRVYTELKPLLEKRDLVQAITHKQPMEQMRELKRNGRYVEYLKPQFKPNRTVLETALLVGDFLGFEEIYLVGIDGFVPRGSCAYCERVLEIRAKCKIPVRFMDSNRPESYHNSSRDMIRGLAELSHKIRTSKIYQTSTLFPDKGLYEFISFEDGLKKVPPNDEGKPDKKNKRL